MPIKFSCGRLFFILFECLCKMLYSTTLFEPKKKKENENFLDIRNDIIVKEEEDTKKEIIMKIRNIPQKPFLTVDSDMKSSNFEIKLKVFQHSTKKENFLPTTLLTAFSSFFYYSLLFLHFSIHSSFCFFLFRSLVSFGSAIVRKNEAMSTQWYYLLMKIYKFCAKDIMYTCIV